MVLITGATGNVGREVVNLSLAGGTHVRQYRGIPPPRSCRQRRS
jgi:nucleoside-diphosphate-sugar epimerase